MAKKKTPYELVKGLKKKPFGAKRFQISSEEIREQVDIYLSRGGKIKKIDASDLAARPVDAIYFGGLYNPDIYETDMLSGRRVPPAPRYDRGWGDI